MFVIVSLIVQLSFGANKASNVPQQWSWATELSSVIFYPDSSVSIDYVVRISGRKACFFSTMDPGSAKNGGQTRTCVECSSYSMDSIRVTLLDSSGKSLASEASPFGFMAEFVKGGTMVVFRRAQFVKIGSKISAVHLSYIHNPVVPVFNSFVLEPREDYSKRFRPQTLPVHFFVDNSP